MTSEDDLVEYNHENELNARTLAEADANDLNACLLEADAEAEAMIAAGDEELAAAVANTILDNAGVIHEDMKTSSTFFYDIYALVLLVNVL